MEFIVRDWLETDLVKIKELLQITWLDAYTFIPHEDLLCYLENNYNEKKFHETFLDKNNFGFVVESNNQIVAYLRNHINEEEKRFYVTSLYVLPSYQGFGLGNLLLNKAEEIAKRLEYYEIWLGVMSENIKSINWYKKKGFHFVEELPFQMCSTIVQHLIGFKEIQ